MHGVILVRVVVECYRIKFLCPVVVLRGVNLEVDRMTDNTNLALTRCQTDITFQLHKAHQILSELIASVFNVKDCFELCGKYASYSLKHCLSVIFLK